MANVIYGWSLALIVTSNCRFRVWDYPVKEMYTNMFKVIKENSPVATAKEGFMRVQEAVKGDFAFIHDAATVRYEVRTNCDLKVILLHTTFISGRVIYRPW